LQHSFAFASPSSPSSCPDSDGVRRRNSGGRPARMPSRSPRPYVEQPRANSISEALSSRLGRPNSGSSESSDQVNPISVFSSHRTCFAQHHRDSSSQACFAPRRATASRASPRPRVGRSASSDIPARWPRRPLKPPGTHTPRPRDRKFRPRTMWQDALVSAIPVKGTSRGAPRVVKS
jgi:hypothetical protein